MQRYKLCEYDALSGFGDIRSFLSTAKKQGVAVFDAILHALNGTPLLALPALTN